MAHDKFNDKFTEPTVSEPTEFTKAAKTTAKAIGGQGAFWAARDAISSYVLSPDTEHPTGIMSLDDIHTDCWCLDEVIAFYELAGTSSHLAQLYKHWINDAISNALKQYINQKP